MQSEGNYPSVYICGKTPPDDFLLGKFLLGGALRWGRALPLPAGACRERGAEEGGQRSFLEQG